MKKFRSPQRPKKSQLILGLQNVLTEIQQGKAIEKIYVDIKSSSSFHQIRKLASAQNIPVNMVPAEKLKSFNADDHGGVIAVRSKINYYALDDLLNWCLEQATSPLLLILDGVTDIRNIGGIARTAFCTGVHGIIIPEKGVGSLNEDAVLTSAGALEQIAVCRTGSLLKAVDSLHAHGFQVFGSEMEARVALNKIDFRQPAAIIMGSEERGIHPALLKACDHSFFIPMKNNFESLNVSVSAGIILYEAMQQREQRQ